MEVGRRATTVVANSGRTNPPAPRLRRRSHMAAQGTTAVTSAASAAPPPLTEPLLDARAAAALLAVRPSWVYEAVRDGRLPHLKIGRHVRFLRSDLEGWVLDQRRRGRP